MKRHLRQDRVFDPDTPIDAPAQGYVLRAASPLNSFHQHGCLLTEYTREHNKLLDETSALFGSVRGIKYPMRPLLQEMNYGDVRAAIAQQIGVRFQTKHKPFVDPDRPEGLTHRVDDPQPEVISDKKQSGFEWRTNIYGV